MNAPAFELTTQWRVAAPVPAVWAVVLAVEQWPDWWRGVREVRKLEAGDEDGLGTVYHQVWRSRLPYSVRFDVETVRIVRHSLLEGRARGELDGRGIWHFRAQGEATLLRYEWRVSATRAWMRRLTPFARALFAWNHDVIMGWGAQGLSDRLGVVVEPIH